MNPNDPTADPFHDCSGCGRSVPQCECDEGDGDGWEDECPDCGCVYCICDSDDRDRDVWGGSHLRDDEWGSPSASPDRWFLADWVRDMCGGVGNVNAIARKDNPHGVGLGGYPWQRRANRRRAMQTGRKWSRETGVPW